MLNNTAQLTGQTASSMNNNWLCVAEQWHDMRPSKSVSRHCADCRCAVYLKQHIDIRHSRTLSPGYLEKYAFSLLHWTGRNLHHGLGVINQSINQSIIYCEQRSRPTDKQLIQQILSEPDSKAREH